MDLDNRAQRDSINARLLTVVDNATNPWALRLLVRLKIFSLQEIP